MAVGSGIRTAVGLGAGVIVAMLVAAVIIGVMIGGARIGIMPRGRRVAGGVVRLTGTVFDSTDEVADARSRVGRNLMAL